MREIEIKLKVKNLKELEKKVLEQGCKLSDEIHQDDVIYSNSPDLFENAKEGDVCVRIRNQDGKSRVTLKQQKSNEMDNLEYETGVDDPAEMHQIFLALGWTAEVEVKKTRKKGKLGEYEICLDNVEKLGSFVELEKMTSDDDDPEKVRDELFKALEVFGLSKSDEETKGYDTQMYQLKKKNEK